MRESNQNVLRHFQLLRHYGLNHPTSGNASNRERITMTGCNADAVVELVAWDSPDCSQDSPIHQFCYEQRPDVQAILHAHPPYTVAIGTYPIIDADWGTEKQLIAEKLVEHGLILHSDHGVYAAATSAQKAYEALCTLEHCSKMAWIHSLTNR